MKVRRKIGDLGKEQIRQLIQDFLDELDEGAVALLEHFEESDSPEYLAVELDEENKILSFTAKDGSHYAYNLKSETIDALAERVSALEQAPSNENFENIEDVEGRLQIGKDAEDKIYNYRKPDGTLVENAGIETNHLELTKQGMSDFQQALRDAGFKPGGSGDYTDKDSMYIPEPRLAHLNIITDFNLTTLTKTSDVKCQVEFTDGAGNYFKKWIILNGQGRSSMNFLKKGLGADFFNEDPNSEDFDEDNVFTMKFGDWVPQDSFHIKSYYTDFPRCTSPVVYKLTDEVLHTRGIMKDRPYKKYYVGLYSDSADGTTEPSKLDYNIETGARCIPDGFPVIVYQNGEFWGVNSWQLKKHRDNYQMSKKKSTDIHLDGHFGESGFGSCFWDWNGNIDWAHYCSGASGIETRNPKNLYCIDGKKYNVDTHDAEIIDTATAEAWIASGVITPTGKTIDTELAGYLKTTGKVRERIEELTTYVPYIQSLIDGDSSTADIKAAIEERFDVQSFIDYILISNITADVDAWDNNGQITTWGVIGNSQHYIWAVNKYDCDFTFGGRFDGISASAANNTKYGSSYPLYKFFWQYYFDELKKRYAELRNAKIFDADHIIQLFRNWMNRVGIENYKKEYEKWPESPCFRANGTYPDYPTEGGFYGSIYRIYLWIKNRIEFMDAADFFDYNNN